MASWAPTPPPQPYTHTALLTLFQGSCVPKTTTQHKDSGKRVTALQMKQGHPSLSLSVQPGSCPLFTLVLPSYVHCTVRRDAQDRGMARLRVTSASQIPETDGWCSRVRQCPCCFLLFGVLWVSTACALGHSGWRPMAKLSLFLITLMH